MAEAYLREIPPVENLFVNSLGVDIRVLNTVPRHPVRIVCPEAGGEPAVSLLSRVVSVEEQAAQSQQAGSVGRQQVEADSCGLNYRGHGQGFPVDKIQLQINADF